MSWRRFTTTVLLLASALTLAVAQAQVPRLPDHGQDPRRAPAPTVPGLAPQPLSQAMPVAPDTVEIRVTVPDSLPQPRAIQVVQDTVAFGGLLHLVLDYAPELMDDQALSPLIEGEWLVPNEAAEPGFWARLLGQKAGPVVDLSELPPTQDQRVIRSFRVYRRDPFQIRWQDDLSRILVVTGQTADAEQTATIRRPRPLTWTPWQLLLAGVILAGLAWLVWRLWRRRQRTAPLEHWPLPAPAWLATATGLQALLAENILARGKTQRFLDRLAFLARDYVAHRYRIPARELTGREIIRACRALGHDVAHPAGFARLIELTDRERYNPEAPPVAFCREQAVQLFGRIARVRLERQYVAVAPDKFLAAQKAWADLTAELSTGAGRPVPSAVTGEVR
ncbi:MAG: hypothetical protein ACTSQ7_12545 [Alphaproteobacteria bacterium]